MLDASHAIVYADYEGQIAGINEYHLLPSGEWCAGWVPFRGYPWAEQFKNAPDYQAWNVVQLSPLTLSPSIKCRACGHHGHIRDGKWTYA